MDVAAWCGRCGGSFPLALAVSGDGEAGRCPRCDQPLGTGYSATVVPAIGRFLAAAEELRSTGAELAATAPALHVDAVDLTAKLGEALAHPRP